MEIQSQIFTNIHVRPVSIPGRSLSSSAMVNLIVPERTAGYILCVTILITIRAMTYVTPP